MRQRWLVVSALAFCLALTAGHFMRAAYSPRLPRLSLIQKSPFVFQDTILSAAGFRVAAADLAWVQLLQYAANNIPNLVDRPGRPYDLMGIMSARVIRLDPTFYRAALYGASQLAWFENIMRPQEAVELLNEALLYTPDQRLYSLYIVAIAYKNKGDAPAMISLLESSFDHPETPSQTKAILANLHQARGELRESLALWERILANERDSSEHSRARLKIAELRSRLRAAQNQ